MRVMHCAVPADVPHVPDDGLGLDELLDDGAHDDEAVVHADHHVPGKINKKFDILKKV
jgi:hypothetical protein